MRLKSYSFIFVAGLVWFVVGLILIARGINFHWEALHTNQMHISDYLGLKGNFAIFMMISICLGLLKAYFVLKKAALRNLLYYFSFTSSQSIFRLYRSKDLILIFAMILLGRLIRWISLPIFVQAMILETVGCALLFGSYYYFRALFSRTQIIQ